MNGRSDPSFLRQLSFRSGEGNIEYLCPYTQGEPQLKVDSSVPSKKQDSQRGRRQLSYQNAEDTQRGQQSPFAL